jgi:hypothetical protein
MPQQHQFIQITAKFNLLIVISLLFISCRKFVEIPPPVDEAVSSEVFENDNMATSAVIGIYSEMMSSISKFSGSEVTFYAGMSADELRFFTPGTRDEFIKNEISASNNILFLNFWEKAYRFIYTANLCLEGLNKSNHLTDEVKSRLTGECKFIRAFCYFHLVNLFGGVPLPLTSDYEINAILPRVTDNAVYTQIIIDLEDAQKLIPAAYAGPNPNTERVRPSKWAAIALLSRVYLYRGNWSGAEARADTIIGSGLFSLPATASVFLKSSNEAIWQLLPVNTSALVNTWEGNVILPSSPFSPPTYLLTDTLLKSFEPNDQRKNSWVKSHSYLSQTYYHPYKYKIKTAPAITEYYMVLRLAEEYLIRAEARARQNKLTEAANDINAIRNRAGLSNTSAVTREELILAIEQERKVELFAEWGHRWYDLKRTGRAIEVLPGSKPNAIWNPNIDLLWPIPSSQIKANPLLIQNFGY